jgi:hypothetical protein
MLPIRLSDGKDQSVADALNEIHKLSKKVSRSLSRGWSGVPEDWRPCEGFYHFHFWWSVQVGMPKATEFCAVLPWRGTEIGDCLMQYAASRYVPINRLVSDKLDARQVQEPMFIPIPHLLEEPQGVGTIPKWLQPLDNGGCWVIDSLDHRRTIQSAVMVLRLVIKDGEACRAFIRPSAVREDQLPDEMIEGRSQLIDDFPGDDREFCKHIIRYGSLNNILSGSQIVVTTDAVRLDSAPNFMPQFFEVLLGPFDLSPIAFQIRRHGVNSAYDQQAEDAQGGRDSHSEAERLSSQSEESHPPREITPLPPLAEVASRTTPARQRGGYTATNTRSGSPEDA